MAWKSCHHDEDIEGQPVNAKESKGSPDNERMYDEFPCHYHDHVDSDPGETSGKGGGQVGADDQQGERYADIAQICQRGFQYHRQVETGACQRTADENADETGAEDVFHGKGAAGIV